jgi:hypothetical protein
VEQDEADGEVGIDQAMDLDDVILFEDVDIGDDFDDGMKEKDDSTVDSKVSQTGEVGKDKPKEVTVDKKKTPVAAKPANKSVSTFKVRGRLVQLKKPVFENFKTIAAIFEILEGRFSKEEVLVVNNRLSVFGHSLSNSNLVSMYKTFFSSLAKRAIGLERLAQAVLSSLVGG